MNAENLEIMFNAKRENNVTNAKARAEIVDNNRKSAMSVRSALIEKLKFLEKYGVKVDKYYTGIAVEIQFTGKHNSHYDVRVSIPCCSKVVANEKVFLYDIQSKEYLVNWHCNVCHNDKDSLLTIEQLVTAIADKL